MKNKSLRNFATYNSDTIQTTAMIKKFSNASFRKSSDSFSRKIAAGTAILDPGGGLEGAKANDINVTDSEQDLIEEDPAFTIDSATGTISVMKVIRVANDGRFLEYCLAVILLLMKRRYI